MDHTDHVALLRDGILTKGGVWADLGSGGGAFTLALADLIGSSGEIFSVDRNRGVLAEQELSMQRQFPEVTVHYMTADFTQPLPLPPLDGIVMANSLHFVRDQDAALQQIKGYLRPGGRLLVVEYNTDRGNAWVPYPMSYGTWEKMAARNGFVQTRMLKNRASRSGDGMFSAESLVAEK